MRKYESHKVVEAARITSVQFEETPANRHAIGSILLLDDGSEVLKEWGWMNEHKASEHSLVGGWLIRYADGDRWCPDEDFERDYAPFNEEYQHHAFFKTTEAKLLARIGQILAENAKAPEGGNMAADGRWLSIARTHFEEGTMAAIRSLFTKAKKPPRVSTVSL